ncbi:hypothetical protein BD408DRAFT_360107 [Parasitella parasitica]|nr:hypothetical protein BD408DRAFT_360107 [Parasitella parasitica]
MTNIPDNLALFTLPSDSRLGSDIMSTIMLKDERLMDIILKDVVGDHASSASYTLGRCERANKAVSNVLYLPTNPDLPPVLVEIQNKVNEDFIAQAIKYCISLKEEYGVQPIMLIFSIKGFANEGLRSRLINFKNSYFDEVSCDFWAQKCQIISPNSIENHLLHTPLNPLVALEHFLSLQKQIILSLDKKQDPTIQLIYLVAKEKFEDECQVEEENLEVIKDLCFKARQQFQKILTCLDKGESAEKVEKYAKDGENFFFRQERKFTGKDKDLIPIEDTPDISNLSTPPSNHDDTALKNNLDYIENYKVNNHGRMKWEACYNDGQNEGFFSTYASFHTLKSAYHNQKSKSRKRKAADSTE